MSGVLGEVTELANASSLAYMVVGGWSPLLWNTGQVSHPGTRDVDLLFETGADAGALHDFVQSLLGAGFLPSAKHPFQLGVVVRVGGQDVVIGVDLLHPLEFSPDLREEMFAKHLELSAHLAPDVAAQLSIHSIALPSAQVLFNETAFETYVHAFVGFDTTTREVDVRLMTEAGLLMSKAPTLHNPKRTRDAFDVALAVVQARNPSMLIEQARRLASVDGQGQCFVSILSAAAATEIDLKAVYEGAAVPRSRYPGAFELNVEKYLNGDRGDGDRPAAAAVERVSQVMVEVLRGQPWIPQLYADRTLRQRRPD